jgi:hypothetical protein
MCRPLVRCTLMDRPMVEIHNQDPIFHVLYDLDDRIQVPCIPYWYSG